MCRSGVHDFGGQLAKQAPHVRAIARRWTLLGGLAGHVGLEYPPDLHQVIENAQVFVVPDRRLQHHGVQEVPLVGQRNPGALALLGADQALLLQDLDRLADHRPADAEGLAEPRLGGEQRPRFELAGHDAVKQHVNDRGPQAGRPLGPVGGAAKPSGLR